MLYGGDWPVLQSKVRALVPEAFSSEGHLAGVWGGEWQTVGTPRPTFSPNDGSTLASTLNLDAQQARRAVQASALEASTWAAVSLDERCSRVQQAVSALREHREMLALLLAWEIGKPVAQARTSVDRTVEGVQWYLQEAGRLTHGQTPVGLVSNIASWNYPLSVLVHSMLVQALVGNIALAKTPSAGGAASVTLAVALARRAGVPLCLVHGSGSQLGEVLIRSEEVDAVAFVGGRAHGRTVAEGLLDRSKRYMLEMEGVNAYGLWDFSDWDLLEGHLTKGYEYGKQRCTAYARFVVQRRLFPQFLENYQQAMAQIKVGHPLKLDGDAAPALTYGPLISADKVRSLQERIQEALTLGAVPIYQGQLDLSRFLEDQDASAYIAPTALLNVPRRSALYHAEPFGPVDTFVLVDTLDELIGEMNVSRGSLVATIATDDPKVAAEVSPRLQAFKVGVNALRSRGDREEPFGGYGESWQGCFVGGEHLIRAVTHSASGEAPLGNFTSVHVPMDTP
ncbi:aldehyde dehydrogenase family protein (plasmid) [Deinococcus radiomollis]|uniref:aldehyde dehydrogenase family protein n=1 Tax=Deinococcus radiomollis TaxID=468916 RepID=UPI003892A41D